MSNISNIRTTRKYELVLLGATGYTGRLTAEHIASHCPTDLRWAIAGRSQSKLEGVAAECKAVNPDRTQPALELCNLDDEDLATLAKKTQLIITTIGPFSIHGEHAFKACAENGTHYIDVTGEVPFVARMIKKYERVARITGSLMFPQIGVESAPPDLITWTLASLLRDELSAQTGEVLVSIHDLTSKPSGGTLATILALLEEFSIQEVQAALGNYGISPIAGPKVVDSRALISKILGVHVDPDLGILTTSIAGSTDRPVVQRSWGLSGGSEFYGPNFHFKEYMRAKNRISAVLFHWGCMMFAFGLIIPVFRGLMRRFIYSPGEGPTKPEYQNDKVEYRGIGRPDCATENGERAFCRVTFRGSLYKMTGIIAAEAAISVLRDEHDLKGGIWTPAMLGQKYIDRLDAAGINFEKRILRRS